ncbi:MAG TPA: glycoside hydrolase family 2 TIM barrel-domain containing protein [Pontiella sp.]
MKRVLIAILLTLSFQALSGYCREQLAVDQSWRFYKGSVENAHHSGFDVSGWESVTIPHTWNANLVKNQTDDTYYKGDGWYRTRLPITSEMIGKRLFLRFEGALTTADIFVNGEKVGRHEGGYTAFCYEITSFVKEGPNTLAVKVSNAYNDDVVPAAGNLYARFGGIYRPVSLLVTDAICITPLDYASSGVYIRQKNVSEQQAELDVTTKISSTKQDEEIQLVTSVFDANGALVATGSKIVTVSTNETAAIVQHLTVDQPHLWDARRNPYLYKTVVQLVQDGEVIDEVIQPLGLRYFHVDVDKGFFLNGKPYDLYGVCRHQEWEYEGSALTDEHHRSDIADIMELGAHAVRLAHYPQAETMYSLCNSNGLVVWAEIPVTPPYKAKNPKYVANAKQQLVEMIRQNYNHPSIFFWGLYNEINISTEHVADMHNLAKAEDPDRLTTAASNKKWNMLERFKTTDIMAWNIYPIWYDKRDATQVVQHIREMTPRDLCIGISEYGAGGCINQHDQNPEKPDPKAGRFYPEEYQNYFHEQVWPDLNSAPFLWCKFIWNMYDFAWPGVTRGERINMNNKGLVTYDRQTRKDSFYYYKANWSEEPVLYITSRRHVVRAHSVTAVKVYSNLKEAALSVNGQEQGIVQPDQYKVAKWDNIELQEGENTITVSGQHNGQIQTDSVVWVYDPAAKDVKPIVENTDNSIREGDFSASSAEQGKGPKDAFDNDLKTRWATDEKGAWLEQKLPESTEVKGIHIYWFEGDSRNYRFEVQTITEATRWIPAYSGTSDGKAGLQYYEFDKPCIADAVRIVCYGRDGSSWSSIVEVQLQY